jgi:hypothetical protein
MTIWPHENKKDVQEPKKRLPARGYPRGYILACPQGNNIPKDALMVDATVVKKSYTWSTGFRHWHDGINVSIKKFSHVDDSPGKEKPQSAGGEQSRTQRLTTPFLLLLDITIGIKFGCHGHEPSDTHAMSFTEDIW